MPLIWHLIPGLITLLLALASPVAVAGGCLSCHTDKSGGFNPAHEFAAQNCAVCHAGDPGRNNAADAHAGMLSFPGNMSNAAETCGACHADKVQSVSHSLMHTGRGMVETTRRLVDGEAGASGTNTVQSLGHGPADSMLRKLCVSCHLGQEKTAHQLNPTSDRGGGCLACHINAYPEDAHPALSREVSDGRCFGCHSRSGRISLSYAGLAEVQSADGSQLRLGDGRHVKRMPSDVHYRAGMACIDCHSGAELMGEHTASPYGGDAVRATCTDCHEPGPGHRGVMADHERLECATCHSQWAPQCFGCHMEYDPKGQQWDHLARAETPGRWHEDRWGIRNGQAALGVNSENRIELFVPGMIMSLAHPDWEQKKFVRVFAPLSPHTIGKARSCESCHRASAALGLGAGTIEQREGEYHFTPEQPLQADGLPADAWTDLSGKLGGAAPRESLRPLSPQEMQKTLSAPLPVPKGNNQQPSSAAGGGSTSSSSVSTNTGGTNGSAGAAAAVAPAHSPTK